MPHEPETSASYRRDPSGRPASAPELKEALDGSVVLSAGARAAPRGVEESMTVEHLSGQEAGSAGATTPTAASPARRRHSSGSSTWSPPRPLWRRPSVLVAAGVAVLASLWMVAPAGAQGTDPLEAVTVL